MSRVSIVIPAFNQAQFLAQAVHSATRQTHADVEVVVVDDGSTDGTADLCGELGALPRVRVVRQENQGVGAARNRGARESTGDYLCFLDADDFYHEDKTARQAAILDGSPSVDWVYCDITHVDEGGVPESAGYSVRQSRRLLNGDILSSLIAGGYFPPHTVMMRRRVFEALGGFDPSLGGHADLDLWLRASAAGHQVEFVGEALAFYRQHPGGMSRDVFHMRETRTCALTRLAREYPERMAAAVSRLEDVHEELYEGNRWLNDALSRAIAALPREPQVVAVLTEEFQAGRTVAAPAEHAALWDVPSLGEGAVASEGDGHGVVRALVLHPPASLSLLVPTGDAITVSGAIALHPDVWKMPDSGACQFQITADDRARWTCLVDPHGRPDDRRWIPFVFDVPARTDGHHQLLLETTGIGSDAHRWALWHGVRAVQRSFSIQKLQPNAGCTPL